MPFESGSTTSPNLNHPSPPGEVRAGDQAEVDDRLPIKGNWFKPFRGEQVLELGITGSSDSVGGITGALSLEGPSRGQMKIRYVEVFSTDDRGKGLGGRLLRAFAAEAKQAGATTLVGDIISEQEIHSRMQTFGEPNVRFYEELPVADGTAGGVVEVPLTREQAIQSLHRAQQADEDATIHARTDLTAVDTSDWGLPEVGDVSRRPNLDDHLGTVAHEVGDLALASR